MKRLKLEARNGYAPLGNEQNKPAWAIFEDPFGLHLSLTNLDKLKIVINFFWLFPLRFFLIALPCVLGGVLLCALLMIGPQDRDRPLRGWRKFILYRVGYLINRSLLFGMGFQWIKITGEPASSKDAPVAVAAPHSSLFDMFLLSLKYIPAFVAREENRNAPIFGRIEENILKCIFVSRFDTDSRQRCKAEIQRRLDSDDEWPPILIFPEGTTTNRSSLLHYKHGAFNLKTPVQPILIKFNNKLNTMLWGDNFQDLAKGILLTFCQFHNSVEIEYLPVYNPSEEEKENPVLYAENVRKVMSQSIAIPSSEHTFEDVDLMRESRSLGMPFAAGGVEFAKNCKPHNITLSQLKKLLKRFACIDRDKDGLISAEDLARFLRVPHDACLQSFFNMMDTSGHKLITFKEYSRILIHSQSYFKDEQLFSQAFRFFDSDSDGVITRGDLFKLPIEYHDPLDHHQDDKSFKKCSLLCRCVNYGKSYRENHQGAEENGEGKVLHLLDLPGPWNYDQFKEVLKDNLEYLLLFDECQNAGISST